MDPFKLNTNTEYSYPHSFMPNSYFKQSGFYISPINPHYQQNLNGPIPVFDINRLDVMSETGVHPGKVVRPSAPKRSRQRK
jgi:hypothetical protein